MSFAPTAWDRNRRKARGIHDELVGRLPRCSKCHQISVLKVCRDCHTCDFTENAGHGQIRDGSAHLLGRCPVCGCTITLDATVAVGRSARSGEVTA